MSANREFIESAFEQPRPEINWRQKCSDLVCRLGIVAISYNSGSSWNAHRYIKLVVYNMIFTWFSQDLQTKL